VPQSRDISDVKGPMSLSPAKFPVEMKGRFGARRSRFGERSALHLRSVVNASESRARKEELARDNPRTLRPANTALVFYRSSVLPASARIIACTFSLGTRQLPHL